MQKRHDLLHPRDVYAKYASCTAYRCAYLVQVAVVASRGPPSSVHFGVVGVCLLRKVVQP